jgi:hypothetical protein
LFFFLFGNKCRVSAAKFLDCSQTSKTPFDFSFKEETKKKTILFLLLSLSLSLSLSSDASGTPNAQRISREQKATKSKGKNRHKQRGPKTGRTQIIKEKGREESASN